MQKNNEIFYISCAKLHTLTLVIVCVSLKRHSMATKHNFSISSILNFWHKHYNQKDIQLHKLGKGFHLTEVYLADKSKILQQLPAYLKNIQQNADIVANVGNKFKKYLASFDLKMRKCHLPIESKRSVSIEQAQENYSNKMKGGTSQPEQAKNKRR